MVGARRACQRLPRRHGPVSTACQRRNPWRLCRRAACRAFTWEVRHGDVVGSAVSHPAEIARGRDRSPSNCVHRRREPRPLPQSPAGLRPVAPPTRAGDRSLQSEVHCELAAAPRLLDRNRNSAPADVALSGGRTTEYVGALIRRRSGRQQPPRQARRWPPVHELLGELPWLDSCAPCPGLPVGPLGYVPDCPLSEGLDACVEFDGHHVVRYEDEFLTRSWSVGQVPGRRDQSATQGRLEHRAGRLLSR
jgi:hypothetical protein